MRRFLNGRVELAGWLLEKEGGPAAVYADVALIATAVLSACAAQRWPGERIDRNRFVELLARHSPPDYRTTWVSIPSLINEGLIEESRTPYGKPGNSVRILIDEEIDLPLDEARHTHPGVAIRDIRRHCYASIIYCWLRCGYAHEYRPHRFINHVPGTRRQHRISYIGRLDGDAGNISRQMDFDLEYLLGLAAHHVSILPDTAERQPQTWWIDLP